MKRALLVLLALLLFGAIRLPAEHALFQARAGQHLAAAPPDLSLWEQIGQLGFIAALGGFRSLIGNLLFIQAHAAWERTDWPRMLLLFRQATTLQPRAVLFWDMAAWHMAWNASAAALHDPTQPRQALRIKAQREYFELGRDFLERGIRNNPERPQLYEALARLYREKYRDHEQAAHYYHLAATKPGAPRYLKRFSLYELSHVDGREQEAYAGLLQLYHSGGEERLPTLIRRLKFLEEQLNIPVQQRIREPGR
ncbi:hypothetical protein BH20VER1_BH20VER1_15200 [soil metagenome]